MMTDEGLNHCGSVPHTINRVMMVYGAERGVIFSNDTKPHIYTLFLALADFTLAHLPVFLPVGVFLGFKL